MPIKLNRVSKKRLKEIWAQVPPDYYDQGIAKNYLQKLWHTHKLSQIFKLLPEKNSKLSILDIGCSSAVLTAEVAKYLPQAIITGLDSPHINFIVADAHKLPFKNKSYDIIICTETLEHLLDPKQALMEAKRVLKSGGKAIISMDSDSLLFRIIWYFWTKTKGKVWKDAHLRKFNTKILEDLIIEAGFKIREKTISHVGMAVTFLAVPNLARK